MSAEKALLQILDEKLRTDTLILPTLPDVVLMVRQRAEDPLISLQEIAEIISTDPALSARIIKVANSAFIGRSIRVNTLSQAVTRIGLTQIKNIVIAVALQQLFVSRHKAVQQRLQQLWQKSTQLAAITVACLKYYNARHENTGLSTDVMALAALTCHIGALPVLAEAERHEDVLGHPLFIERLLDKVSAHVSGKVLSAWAFPDEFIHIATQWQQLKPERPAVSYADFIRLSAIADNYYQDKDAQQRLLNYYIAQQMAPVPELMQETEIADIYHDVRSLFN